ncbi:shikimate dehydrogenase [Mumia zhuanghuii]|uniref:Shikimate dehydrogenase n=2 Tax=Mumia TaxID=1546255 RepID=A0ABW1QI53_9ACTN|nr:MULTISPECIES: shikimate dehydrogenase [Mumia]KAA1418304.1 shikimate dehydrogenase [Mumia zhuanghuii]
MSAPRGTDRSVLVGLLGHGVKPSLTPEMHEREAQRHGLRYVYKTVDLEGDRLSVDHLRGLLAAAVELGFDGLNITHPIKRTMLPLVDERSAEVERIGALNTVLVRDGVTRAYNTDVTGFARAFREGLPGADLGAVVLLGAGGAGTAVADALVDLGAGRLHLVDPDRARAEALRDTLARTAPEVEVAVDGPEALADALTDASGLVNATPVGMAHHPGTPVPDDLLTPQRWVADIVYRPLVTELLRTARAHGCPTLSGAGMAVHQAADTFELLTGRTAHREEMFRDFDELVSAETDSSTDADVASTTHRSRESSGERNH